MPAPGVDQAQGPRGLSLLVQQVLGKPLDKSQQLSNWDRRPLAEGQLLYAGTCPCPPCPALPAPPGGRLRLPLPPAADAYCLLEVYWALCREPARCHLVGDLARSPRPGHCERPGAPEPPGPQEASAPPQQVTGDGGPSTGFLGPGEGGGPGWGGPGWGAWVPPPGEQEPRAWAVSWRGPSPSRHRPGIPGPHEVQGGIWLCSAP